jgi:hypothetical protein
MTTGSQMSPAHCQDIHTRCDSLVELSSVVESSEDVELYDEILPELEQLRASDNVPPIQQSPSCSPNAQTHMARTPRPKLGPAAGTLSSDDLYF